MSKEWWYVEGAPKPIYIYSSSGGRRLRLVFVLITAIIVLLTYFIDMFSSEIAFLLISLLIFSQVIEGIYSLYRRAPGEAEKSLVRNIVGLLSRKIIAWSIPTRYIVAAIKLSGGLMIYVYMDKGRSYVLVLKPIIFLNIISGKKLSVVKVKKKIIKHGKIIEERLEALAPYPENPRIWYRIIGRGFIEDTSRIELNKLIDIINKMH